MTERPELNLDRASQAGFVSFFNSLGEKEANVIRLFERNGGEYYSAHGTDAIYIAREFYRTNSVLKQMSGSGSSELPSCTLSKASFESFLRDALQIKLLKIQIWGPSESRKANGWVIIKEASPGNIRHVEDMVTLDTNDPVIVSVMLVSRGNEISVGVGIADASEKTLAVTEFLDNDLLTNLETLLVQLCVRECVICEEKGSGEENKRLKALLEMSGIVVSTIPRRSFVPLDLMDVNRLLREPLVLLPNTEIALCALNALIVHLDLLSDEAFYGELTFNEHKTSQFARLDSNALSALGLFGEGPRKNIHLFGLLNRCITKGGSRLLYSWIRQPLMNIDDIRARHAVVGELFETFEVLDACRKNLQLVPDVGRLVKKIRRGSASLQDIVLLYQFAVRLPQLLEVLNSTAVIQQRFAPNIARVCSALEQFAALVEDTIDLDAVEDNEYIIKPTYSEELGELSSEIEQLKATIEPEANLVANKIGVELHKTLKVENHSIHGYHFRMSISASSALKNKEFIEISTLKTGVLFTTPRLQRASREILRLTQEYVVKQNSLVKELMKSVATFVDTFSLSAVNLSELDVFCAFAEASRCAPSPYVMPQMSEQDELRLVACRHPCVEVQDGMAFIPNDVEMIRDTSNFLVITGPNMGGKSTYIRQIGIVSLMAQIGCFVPCTTAVLPVFDAIMCRIGASDDQMRGISTFMAEMLEAATLLRTSTSRSLLIIDEIGRGTSTYDGFGLAYAISSYLATTVQCFCLFATHFHEMTSLANTVPSAKNLHVVACAEQEAKDITLLYRVAPGPCDESFGIHVAKMAGLPASVIAMAELKVEELSGPELVRKSIRSDIPLGDVERATSELEDGHSIINDFLNEFKKIDMDQLGWEDLMEQLKQKYAPIIAKNAYLSQLMQKFSVF